MRGEGGRGGARGGGACGGAWPRAGAGVAEGRGVRGGPGAGRARARAESARGSRRPIRDLRMAAWEDRRRGRPAWTVGALPLWRALRGRLLPGGWGGPCKDRRRRTVVLVFSKCRELC